MKILVTGGAGFIGSHLVNRLAEMNNEVVVLDNLSKGKKENVNKKARFVLGDIRDPVTVNTAMSGCEAVFHLAALTDARSSDDDAMYQVNFLGSENVFKIAKNVGARVIFASSAAVYGEAKCSEDGACAPLSQYGKSKLKAEKALQKQDSAFIGRIFNAYGPRGSSVINKFCSKIPEYQEVTVLGSGLQTRDFVHVNDVVNALILGLEHNGLYNIGTGTETSVLQLIDLIHNITKAKPAMKFMPPVEGDIKRSRADIEKIKSIGWQPRLSIEDGVRSLLADMGWKPLNI